MLSIKDSIFLEIEKHDIMMRTITCVSWTSLVITLILFGRSAIQPVCLFNVYLFAPFH